MSSARDAADGTRRASHPRAMLAARVTAARATLRTRSVTMRAHVLCASRRVSARADVKTSANSKSHKVHLRAGATPRATTTTRAARAATRTRAKNKSTQAEAEKSREGAIAKRSEDFSKWYLDCIRECQLADYGPARGTMVIRPYGYAIWEGIQKYMDAKFKATGVQNAYFPQLIPYSFITKEASHVEGFAPELALVTRGGGKELEEPLVVRPTSETIVNNMLSQWIQSYRDLPMLLNQWCNVHRWEMRTRPFIRTLEFLWQEGHTAHATAEEAEERAMQMIRVYAEFAQTQAAMPVIPGRKSRVESFAGANVTYTIEAMMGDKKALQAGTSHNLGDNFAKAFDTTFLDDKGETQYVHQSSWGVSTRLIGGILMTHGDDAGLILPPRLAPIQVVVVPIWKKDEEKEAVMASVDSIISSLSNAGVRTHLDADQSKSPGWKFNQYEMKGVPIRIEVGPKDVAKGACVVARRDVPGKEGKEFGVSIEPAALETKINDVLNDIQNSMLQKATEFRDANIVDVKTMDELKATIEAGKWARCGWEGTDEEEKAIKEETGATIRCFPFDQPAGEHTCLMSGKPAKEVCIFAKSY